MKSNKILVISLIIGQIFMSGCTTYEEVNKRKHAEEFGHLDTSEIIEFEDVEFEKCLLRLDGKLKVDLNYDNKISVYEAENYQVTTLKIDKAPNIKSIEGIQYFKNLTGIVMNHNKVSDISPIKDLKKLYLVQIDNTEIENIEVIAELPNVKYLVLKENKIKDISPFINNKQYYSFNVSGNSLMTKGPETVQIGIVGCAARWTYDVFVAKESVPDVAEKNHEAIRFKDQNLLNTLIEYGVDINGDNQVSIYEANRWKGMLYLRSKNISFVDGLEYFDNIHFLNLHGNEISSIGKLSEMDNLKHLNLTKNKLREFSFDTGFGVLETLEVLTNEIKELDQLLKIKTLKSLDVSGNPISSISGIVNHPNLEKFASRNCEIRELSFAQKNIYIREIEIDKNKLKSLETIEKLDNLNLLLATGNYIEDLRPLMGLKDLKELNLYNNPMINGETEDAIKVGEILGYEVWKKNKK